MTEHTHTPGPWRVETDGPGKRDSGVYVMTPGQGICKLYEVTPPEWIGDRQTDTEANARLIAKAPEQEARIEGLLEVLRLVEMYLEHPDVQAIPFALPASVPLKKVQFALGKEVTA